MTYLTETEALAQGFTVDHTAPGRPIAYRGRRFQPTAVVGVRTKHEETLRAALEAIRQAIDDDDASPASLQATARRALQDTE